MTALQEKKQSKMNEFLQNKTCPKKKKKKTVKAPVIFLIYS